MGDDAALRPPGGAGGVDEAGLGVLALIGAWLAGAYGAAIQSVDANVGALLGALILFSFTVAVQAEPGSAKMSGQALEALENNPNEWIDVIVVYEDQPRNSDKSKAEAQGGEITRAFGRLPMRSATPIRCTSTVPV